eukprot:Awhi_evm1s2700
MEMLEIEKSRSSLIHKRELIKIANEKKIFQLQVSQLEKSLQCTSAIDKKGSLLKLSLKSSLRNPNLIQKQTHPVDMSLCLNVDRRPREAAKELKKMQSVPPGLYFRLIPKEKRKPKTGVGVWCLSDARRRVPTKSLPGASSSHSNPNEPATSACVYPLIGDRFKNFPNYNTSSSLSSSSLTSIRLSSQSQLKCTIGGLEKIVVSSIESFFNEKADTI